MIRRNMSRADRDRWAAARTLPDLGELMALWLTGRIASQPGYQPRTGPDRETRGLVPDLARLCRSGYVTTCSQPGEVTRHSEQRAAVDGYTDRRTADRLTAAARRHGWLVAVIDLSTGRRTTGDPIVVTTSQGRPFTTLAGDRLLDYMPVQWEGIAPDLYATLTRGRYVALAHPTWGPAGQTLWPALVRAVR